MTVLLQRLCWNTNRWRGPTGDMYGREDSFVGENGFGHEEWNLNTSDLIDDRIFGYMRYNPSADSPLLAGLHDIFFFTVSPSRERTLVGFYRNARFLNSDQKKTLQDKFLRSELLEKRMEELIALDLPTIKTEKRARSLLLGEFASNISVDPNDVYALSGLPTLSAEMLLGREPKYFNRYSTPVFLDAEPIIPDTPIPPQFEIGHLLEEAYVRFTKEQQKVIARQHNILSNRFQPWLKENGAERIRTESQFVDVQCYFNGKHYLFELKTCAQQHTRPAIREALGQLLEYGYYPGRAIPDFLAVVLDTVPAEIDIEWCKNLAAKGVRIELFWLKGKELFSAKLTSNPLAKLARSN